jgi:5-methylcytosine-specific restriction protein A
MSTGRRTVDEWIGSSPDAAIPPRVKLRIWERCGGKCHLTGHKIRPGDAYDFDHIVALCNGGEHRESNLAPALRAKHREKTAADVAEMAKIDRLRKRHLGLVPKKPRSNLVKKLNGQVVYRDTGLPVRRSS